MSLGVILYWNVQRLRINRFANYEVKACSLGTTFNFVSLKIAVEVEDDYPDGIVQAEEEEEERLEPEAFSGSAQAVFRGRERVPRMTTFRGSVDSTSQPSSGKKRKIDGTAISGMT